MWRLFAAAHLMLAGVWLGAMTYSLLVVQPKVTRFFADPGRREEFLTVLAAGNRRSVVALISALVGAGGVVVVTAPPRVAAGYALGLIPLLAVAVIFWYVSWRHWPARLFALPDEVPGFQRRLRLLARIMIAFVAVSLLIGLAASVGR